jgi:integrase
MSLTHLKIAAAKPRQKPYKLTDAQQLYLVVQPTGAKLWRMNYRHGGRQKTLHLGTWPALGIADARAKRDEARSKVAGGEDPAAAKRIERLTASANAANSFEAVAEEWLGKCEREGRAEITLSKIRWLLRMAYPLIGNRPVSEITPQEALAVLRVIESSGRYESARRMRSVLGRVFRYAIATARAQRDPAADLRGALTTPQVRHLPAITDAKQVGGLLRAMEGYTGHPITAIALRLTPHLFVRPGELRQAEWAEIDEVVATWKIPAAKMKMRRPHAVPLSRQVLEMLGKLRPLTGHGRYLFPSFRSSQQAMSENTVNAALRRLGYNQEEMTAHGFRSTAATLLNEMGLWNADAIEKQLAHMDGNMVRRAYTRGEYWAERVRMMQHWSDYLDQLRLEV